MTREERILMRAMGDILERVLADKVLFERMGESHEDILMRVDDAHYAWRLWNDSNEN